MLRRGGPDGIRTHDLSDANQPPKLFSSISGRFYPFSLRPSSSLDLLGHTVSVWSGAVCGRFCGQKRSPALAGVFRRQGRGAFFIPLTAWIVTLRAELNKSFLCSPRLRNCGTVNKRYQRPEGRVEVGDCGLAGAQQLENSSWVLHRSRTGIFDRKILQRQADLVSSVLLHVVDFQDIIISPGYLSRLSAQQLENI